MIQPTIPAKEIITQTDATNVAKKILSIMNAFSPISFPSKATRIKHIKYKSRSIQ